MNEESQKGAFLRLRRSQRRRPSPLIFFFSYDSFFAVPFPPLACLPACLLPVGHLSVSLGGGRVPQDEGEGRKALPLPLRPPNPIIFWQGVKSYLAT